MAMDRLKMAAGCPSSCNEVEVHVDVRPGDRIVVYLSTSEGELNFNRYLVETGLAVRATHRAPPSPRLPSHEQLMSAVESMSRLQTGVEPPTVPVKPVQKTSPKKPVTTDATDTAQSIHYAYLKGYTEGGRRSPEPCVSLEESRFPASVCRALSRQGFQAPTVAQACSWPVVGRRERGLATIVAPANSGKTLAYLLPLAAGREASRGGPAAGSQLSRPRLVVVVPGSWEARAVHTRALEIMAAQSPHRRSRYVHDII
jgi:hypothetical protein